MIARFQRGEGRPEDFALLEDIIRGSKQRTICVFPEAFAGPLATALRHFRGEFERRIAPTGAPQQASHG